MELVVANGQIGSYGSGRNWFRFPQFSSDSGLPRRLVVFKRANFAVGLSAKRRIEVFCGALAGGEEQRRSVAGQSLVECEFRPMFDDYVKVMESVRIDRSKLLVSDDEEDGEVERTSRRNYGASRPRNKRDGKLGEVETMGYERSFPGPREGLRWKDSKGRGSDREAGEWRADRNQGNSADAFLEKDRFSRNYKASTRRVSDAAVDVEFRSEENSRSTGISKNITSLGSQKGRMECVDDDDFKDQKNVGTVWKRDKASDRNNGNTVSDKSVRGRIQGHAPYGEQKSYKRQTTHIHVENNTEGKQDGTAHRRNIYENAENRMYKYEERNLEVQGQRHDRGNGRSIRNSDTHTFQMDFDGNESLTHSTYSKRDVKDRGESLAKWRSSGSLNIRRETRSQGQFMFHEGGTRTEEYASKIRETEGRSGKNSKLAHKTFVRDVDTGIEDRAAFKTYEIFTDVRNRPRVLRMEMEERIRNLAKWLNATDVNMPEWQFSRMMHNAKIKFTDHSILRVVQILGEFGNWRRVLQVVEWLKTRERFKSYKSKYIYTAVLDALGKAKKPMEALNIFHVMRQERASYPDFAAYHCIAVTLGQAGLMKELFDVIDCMKSNPKKKMSSILDQKMEFKLEPDLIVYNAVLNACVQQKQWEGAFWVLQQLKLQGIRPSSTTYGLVMEVMLACGKYNLVHEFFKKVEKTSIPNMLNYKVLVNTFWKENKIDEAVSAVQDMERRGIVGSASVYYDLARCLCSAGRCQEALSQIAKVCKVAKKPLVVTYTGLIQACVDSGNIQNGAYIFSEMCKVCSPNVVTCNIMLKSYLEHGMYKEAMYLFRKILDGSNDIRSKSDLKWNIVPDKFTFNVMMEASITEGNWDNFEDTYTQMLHHGYHFAKKRHLRMVMDAVRAGKEKVLETTWQSLVQSGRVVPPAIIKERFRLKIVEDNFSAAISCLNVHIDEPGAFSTDSWLHLLKFNADSIRTETVSRLTCELKTVLEESDQPSLVLQNLLKACVTFLCSSETVAFNSLDKQVSSSDVPVLTSY